ncbi:PEPxxWA-CTERM sorting domain-containing protein [Sphingobium lignivorans]|uniref:Ice-binding protein C-terminal domain-containing protein n=1 Tax=Sphingobium lignivorans TaxID=2735886 RepID=A0ABR6NDB1_9SPHN|nr:PEPxxWA-CTERM sorting domain-containing protein [Sphingobium lignivorans]MBB5984667.1 hypothetical protein [Sphingobium lignivorans]
MKKLVSAAVVSAACLSAPAGAADFLEYRLWGTGTERRVSIVDLPGGGWMQEVTYHQGAMTLYLTLPVNRREDEWWQTCLYDEGGANCYVSGNSVQIELYAAYSGGDVALIFDHALSRFPDSNEGFLGATLDYHYGAKYVGSSYYFEFRWLNVRAFNAESDRLNVIRFNYSPGIPEPATWAMMIGGFALAGGALRRRRGMAARVRGVQFA